jgi:hypothetical protein
LLDDNRHYNLIAMLAADDFADNIHALIFDAIGQDLDAGRPAYRSMLQRELADRLDEVGGDVQTALADSRIEGFPPPSDAELEICAAYIRGEFEAKDLVEVYKKAQHACCVIQDSLRA